MDPDGSAPHTLLQCWWGAECADWTVAEVQGIFPLEFSDTDPVSWMDVMAGLVT